MIIKKKIRVLIVDDSAVVRQTLKEIFNSDPDIEVMDTASDPYIAVKKIKEELPDVVSLDIEMPRMDGLTFLRKIMTQHPLPVVVISTLTEAGSDVALKALSYGAAEIVAKPKIHTRELLLESTIVLCDAIKAAYASRRNLVGTAHEQVTKELSVESVIPMQETNATGTSNKIIAIGSSTGGTGALLQILADMPLDCPGVVIAQHMPEGFTKSFAQRLDSLCQIHVKEAEDGDLVEPGKALIAPGNRHMLLSRTGSRYKVKIENGPLVSRHRPSVDMLFSSTAQRAGQNSIGIILTGMGDDGAMGMLEMKEAGAYTIAQNEKSCVVFGMPKEAIKLGAVHAVLPLNEIASHILGLNFQNQVTAE